MPYSRKTFWEPSERFKLLWPLVPQGRKISVSGYSTPSMYADLSSSIPLFYILMILAIIIDIYLGFSILAKSGVSFGLIIAAILGDFTLAILPFMLSFFTDVFRPTYVKNKIFQNELMTMSKRNGEEDMGHFNGVEMDLKKFKTLRFVGKLLHWLIAIIIFAIAGWKIFTYYSVLPPGFSIFSMVNGKIVIIFSILCACFHLIGSEKAVAHLFFWISKKNDFNSSVQRKGNPNPEQTIVPIDYKGDFRPCKSGNSEVFIDEDSGEAMLAYHYIIWDEEIADLMQHQTDERAARAIAIKSKITQLT